jgi:hypothetical protein
MCTARRGGCWRQRLRKRWHCLIERMPESQRRVARRRCVKRAIAPPRRGISRPSSSASGPLSRRKTCPCPQGEKGTVANAVSPPCARRDAGPAGATLAVFDGRTDPSPSRRPARTEYLRPEPSDVRGFLGATEIGDRSGRRMRSSRLCLARIRLAVPTSRWTLLGRPADLGRRPRRVAGTRSAPAGNAPSRSQGRCEGYPGRAFT